MNYTKMNLAELNKIIWNNGLETKTGFKSDGREMIYLKDEDGKFDFFAIELDSGKGIYEFTCSGYENRFGTK